MSDLSKLRKANRARQNVWPGAEEIDAPFRVIEFSGEAGEVADAAKKLIRYDRSIAGNGTKTRGELLEDLKDEIGDALITLDALADKYNIDLAAAMADKFNKTSRKNDLPILMHPITLDTVNVAEGNGQLVLFDDVG